jgi:hypothetical protein
VLIVRLTSGKLLIFSPVALTAEVKKRVNDLGGDLAYIVAPDIEHHIFISDWAKEYPSAKIIGPEGLSQKRQKMSDEKIGNENISFIFSKTNKQSNDIDADFAADFEVEYVDAHPNKEIVLLYKPEKILIEADFMFNLPAIEQYSKVPEVDRKPSFLSKMFGGLQSTSGEAKGMKRLLWYGLSAGDRTGFNASTQRVDKWDFHTIIPCHGETIEGNGKEVFQKVFEWHLKA